MRPLLVILHERPLQSLLAAARFWDLPLSDHASDLVGALYPVLTDSWQLALGLERIGQQAWLVVTALARHRVAITPSGLATDLGVDESTLLPTLRSLYSAAILATQSSEQGPHVYLTTEIGRLVTRLEQERAEPLPHDAPLPDLLARLADHELLELAERYGMQVLPTVTSRQEATAFLLERLTDPERRRDLRQQLPPRAQQLLDDLIAVRRPVPVRVFLGDPAWSFGEFRRAIAELARWGLVWRTDERGTLSVLVPHTLNTALPSPSLPRPVEEVEPGIQWSPVGFLIDLLALLALVGGQRTQLHARPVPSGPVSAVTSPRRLLRDEPGEQAAYVAFLTEHARRLGLLTTAGSLERSRLAQWLRLPFAEQARRVFRVWRAGSDHAQGTPRDRILQLLRTLRHDAWYEWSALVRQDRQDPSVDRRHEPVARELDWLGILQRGRTAAGTLAVRLTPWGAWLLGLHSVPPASVLSASVRIDGCPTQPIASLTPTVAWFLSRSAELERVHPEPCWLLTSTSIARLVRTSIRGDPSTPVQHDFATAAVRTLEGAIGQPLPPAWRDRLREWFAHSRPAVAQSALVLRFVDDVDRERARETLVTAQWSVVPLGRSELVVFAYDPRQRSKLVSILRRSGFVLEWSTDWNPPEPQRADPTD